MNNIRYWFAFWAMIFLSVLGELFILIAAAYIALIIYKGSTFSLNFIISALVVAGVIIKLSSEVIKRKGFNL